MREFKRRMRVSRMIDRRDPVMVFAFWVIVLHGCFVLGYLTVAILNS